MRTLALALLLCLTAAAQNLRVYAIDTEGGKATLYISPSGQSLLVDAGYDSNDARDAGRIVAAARAAGVNQIDYLLITHYHRDHAGGVAQLAARMPIRNFVDYGIGLPEAEQVYLQYAAVRAKGHHLVVKPGDRIPIDGLQVDVVSAMGLTIKTPLPGAGAVNPLCRNDRMDEPEKAENSRSVGIVITLGRFRLMDLGDLFWNREYALACPNNLIGTIDVYMTTHHGKPASGLPALVQGVRPRAAIMNNGATLGASKEHWRTIDSAPGRPDIWQIHYAEDNGREHNAPRNRIANLSARDCAGNPILLTARPDGSFTIRNSRTGREKPYPRR